MKRLSIATVLLLTHISAAHGLEIGTKPPVVELSGSEGGKVEGGPWSSQTIEGRITVLFYVDPDEKDLNNPLSDALKKESFSADVFQSIAVINLAATWAPNFIIESKLKEKQKEFPRTIYVKDKDKVLVKKWKLGDDNNVFVLFDRDGQVLYHRDGQVRDVEQVISMIKVKVGELESTKADKVK